MITHISFWDDFKKHITNTTELQRQSPWWILEVESRHNIRARGQQKNPRPRTNFSRTGTLKAKDRYSRDQESRRSFCCKILHAEKKILWSNLLLHKNVQICRSVELSQLASHVNDEGLLMVYYKVEKALSLTKDKGSRPRPRKLKAKAKDLSFEAKYFRNYSQTSLRTSPLINTAELDSIWVRF